MTPTFEPTLGMFDIVSEIWYYPLAVLVAFGIVLGLVSVVMARSDSTPEKAVKADYPIRSWLASWREAATSFMAGAWFDELAPFRNPEREALMAVREAEDKAHNESMKAAEAMPRGDRAQQLVRLAQTLKDRTTARKAEDSDYRLGRAKAWVRFLMWSFFAGIAVLAIPVGFAMKQSIARELWLGSDGVADLVLPLPGGMNLVMGNMTTLIPVALVLFELLAPAGLAHSIDRIKSIKKGDEDGSPWVWWAILLICLGLSFVMVAIELVMGYYRGGLEGNGEWEGLFGMVMTSGAVPTFAMLAAFAAKYELEKVWNEVLDFMKLMVWLPAFAISTLLGMPGFILVFVVTMIIQVPAVLTANLVGSWAASREDKHVSITPKNPQN